MVLGFVIAVNIILYVWFPFLPWSEERQAGEEIAQDTFQSDQAVEEYEWFRQQYHDIDAQRSQVENSYDELDRFYEVHGDDPNEWSRQASERHNRIQERITGNQNMLDQMVADYNARSSMDNRELFKCHLPYQVDERFAISGPPGSGEADQPQDVDPDGEVVEESPPPAEECDGLPDEIPQDE